MQAESGLRGVLQRLVFVAGGRQQVDHERWTQLVAGEKLAPHGRLPPLEVLAERGVLVELPGPVGVAEGPPEP